jgi:ubiquinone/menaquinone biosynthesis C-methylase UbiE
MKKATDKEYWESFFRTRGFTGGEITRNEVLTSVLCDDIEQEYLIPERAKLLLEAGCGQALFSKIMVGKGYKAVCVDFSTEALALAKENFGNNNCRALMLAGDVTSLPVRSDSIDMVYSGGLLDIFDRPADPLRELARVLKVGGMVVAAIPSRKFSVQTLADCYNSLIHVMKSAMGKPSPHWNIYRSNLRHAKNYSIDEYKRAFHEAGFDVLHGTSGYLVPEISLPSRLKKMYVKWLAKNRDRFRGQLLSSSRVRTCMGIYYYIFARKNS